MSVHYKFKSALSFDTITFDGLHISVKELKKLILHQKQIGKTTDFDLQIINAQTEEVYDNENTLIPKNSSLIVSRVPLTLQQKKAWERAEANQPQQPLNKGQPLDTQPNRMVKGVNLVNMNASEEDKIAVMMSQSTHDYDPSNYMRIRGQNQIGELPSSYVCHRCQRPGHWIKDCTFAPELNVDIRKSTGIPLSFMVPVADPTVPGAMMTPAGHFAVPALDHEAYKEVKKERPPFQPEPEKVVVEKPNIPEDLVCSACHDLLTDAVMIPCCGNSFCDDCIRNILLESEEHECPDCKEKDISPETLIPNRFLRTAVNNFRNQTGYNRQRPIQPVKTVVAPVQIADENPPENRASPPRDETKVSAPDSDDNTIEIVHEVPSVAKSEATVTGHAISSIVGQTAHPVVAGKPAEGSVEGSQINVVSNRPRPIHLQHSAHPPHPSMNFIPPHHHQTHHQHQPPPDTHPSGAGPIIHHEVKPPLGRPKPASSVDLEKASENPNTTIHSHYSEAAPSHHRNESVPTLTPHASGTDTSIRPPGQDTPSPDPGMMMPPVHQHPPAIINPPPPGEYGPPPGMGYGQHLPPMDPSASNWNVGAPPPGYSLPIIPMQYGPPRQPMYFDNKGTGMRMQGYRNPNQRGRSRPPYPGYRYGERGVVLKENEDPLAAFERHLAEKDARDKKRKHHRKRSHSRSYSRSPVRHKKSRSPRKSSRSPRKSSGSPRKKSRSPRKKSRSPRKKSRSPRKISRSPRKMSRSPRKSSLSPRKSTRSPRKMSLSPRSSRSPRKKSISPRSSRSPRKMSRSPRKMSRSPRKLSRSPRNLSLSPRKGSLPPRKVSRSPRKLSRSPRKMSLSPRKSSRSPRKISRSPRKMSRSPRKRSLTPRKSPIAGRKISRSPRKSSRSPRRISRSPRKSSRSPKKSRSVTRKLKSLSPRKRTRSPNMRRSRSRSYERRRSRSRSPSFSLSRSRSRSPHSRKFSPRPLKPKRENSLSPYSLRHKQQPFRDRSPPPYYDSSFQDPPPYVRDKPYRNNYFRGNYNRGMRGRYPRSGNQYQHPSSYYQNNNVGEENQSRFGDRSRGGNYNHNDGPAYGKSRRYNDYGKPPAESGEYYGRNSNFDDGPRSPGRTRVKEPSERTEHRSDHRNDHRTNRNTDYNSREPETEQRERDRIREYETKVGGFYTRKSPSPPVEKHARGRYGRDFGEENEYKNVQVYNSGRYSPDNRIAMINHSVLVDLKREPSMEKEYEKEKEKRSKDREREREKDREREREREKDKEKEKEKEKDKEKEKSKEKKKKKSDVDKKEKKKKKKEKEKEKEREKEKEKKEKQTEVIKSPVKSDEPSIAQRVVEDPVNEKVSSPGVEGSLVKEPDFNETEPAQNMEDVPMTDGEDLNKTDENVMLAEVPEKSKWELDEDIHNNTDDKLNVTMESKNEADSKVVTSEVLKRAENAIFQKAVNAIRSSDIPNNGSNSKKPSPDTVKIHKEEPPPKKEEDEQKHKEPVPPPEKIEKTEKPERSEKSEKMEKIEKIEKIEKMEKIEKTEKSEKTVSSREAKKAGASIQITIPSKSPAKELKVVRTDSDVRISAKDRLGPKADSVDDKIRISKQHSKAWGSDRKYQEQRIVIHSDKPLTNLDKLQQFEKKAHHHHHSHDKKKLKETAKIKSPTHHKAKKEKKHSREEVKKQKTTAKEVTNKELRKERSNPRLVVDRKKSITLDESNFEPDYDALSHSEGEIHEPSEERIIIEAPMHIDDGSEDETVKKRSRSKNSEMKEVQSKKVKVMEVVKVASSASSDSESSSSSESSEEERKKKKKKKTKKKRKHKKRKVESSDSDDSDDSSDDSVIETKKKHKKTKKKVHKKKAKKKKSKK